MNPQETANIASIPKPIISKSKELSQDQKTPEKFSSVESTWRSSTVPIAQATRTDMTVTVKL